MNRLLIFALLFILFSCKKHTPVPPSEYTIPATEDLVIYELFLRSFSEEGTLQAVTNRLDELQQLGINCLWIMPPYPVGEVKKINPLGSPYSVREYRQIDPAYGTPADLEKLISEAHQRGIAVILDFVANHTAWDNPWINDHPEMYTKNPNGQITHPPGTNWMDVADLNYGYRPTRDSMISVMKWWIKHYDLDGFRCDYAEGVPVSFWEEAIDSLEKNHELIMLAEGEDRNLLEAGFDLAYSWSMFSRMKDVFDGSRSATWPESLATSEHDQDPAGSTRMYFFTNHDFISFEDPPLVDFKSYAGIQAAAVALTCMPGVPMIYNGQEAGSMQRLDLFHAVPIDWDDPENMRHFFQKLYGLYHQIPELRDGEYHYYNQRPEVLTFDRIGQKRSLVVCNVRNTEVTLALPLDYQDLVLEEQFSGDIYFGDSLTLQPYQYLLLRTTK